MTNVMRQTNLKSYEWNVEAPNVYSTRISETFTLKNRKCNLELSAEHESRILRYYLRFKSDGELHPAINMILRLQCGSLDCLSIECIKGVDDLIWNEQWNKLSSSLLTFVIIFDEISTEDKSIQTPSYTDTRLMLESVSKNFSKLFDESSNCDVEFVCGDENIKAHKNILCCLSDVFKSMLQSDMVEGKTGRVNIQDMDAITFKLFLRFLYTGSLPELTMDTAMQFYKASDKYTIDTLKEQCADFLADNLCTENACAILVWADLHNDAVLKNNALDYIFKEKIPLMGKKWTDFCNENRKLAIEVLNLFCHHLNEK